MTFMLLRLACYSDASAHPSMHAQIRLELVTKTGITSHFAHMVSLKLVRVSSLQSSH